MGSRDKDPKAPHHQPLLSSLVVRPSTSDGACGGGGRGSDYEPGEVRHEPLPYTRSDRYSKDPGHRMRAGSASPVHRRDAENRYSSEYNQSGGPPRGRDFGSARDSGRYRDRSPHFARGRGVGRPFGRGLDGPGLVPGPFRGEGSRNNPNVQQRIGDWICPDPLCGNLNFARREYCNNCNKSRHGPGGSPRRGYSGPPPPNAPHRRFPGPPIDPPPFGRSLNGGYRSPPRGWARNGPRDFGPGLPPPRHEGRFPDHQLRRDRLDYSDNYRGRSKFDRPLPMDWGNRDRGRDSFFNERKPFDRRLPSPSPPPPHLPPHRGRWAHDARERSRSPLRGGPPPKDYNRPLYTGRGRGRGRGREDHRGMGRDRVGDAY
ncbi:transcription initiation factor TFIID subunit 15-like isoform X1 [Malus sylvestris]|uniref:transcription initiation factor TFIID subunit 15-like isoform X1 n=1 Tax=Malus sylvestris TaxID=3752 RepID=UPI0021ABD2A2|nr:transcription initiation factor TFIID subunit 15-like isoform X1 [Malus sylvestris]